jgi:hypothetical protein
MGSDSWQYGVEGRSWALGLCFVLGGEQYDETLHWGVSSVFGGQQYEETVQFCVWRAAV